MANKPNLRLVHSSQTPDEEAHLEAAGDAFEFLIQYFTTPAPFMEEDKRRKLAEVNRLAAERARAGKRAKAVRPEVIMAKRAKKAEEIERWLPLVEKAFAKTGIARTGGLPAGTHDCANAVRPFLPKKCRSPKVLSGNLLEDVLRALRAEQTRSL